MLHMFSKLCWAYRRLCRDFAGVKNRRAIKYHWDSSKHKIELHVSKDCTRRFSSSTHFNKSVTGVGTILSSFLLLVECMLGFQMLSLPHA
jgi:hypothetical protein